MTALFFDEVARVCGAVCCYWHFRDVVGFRLGVVVSTMSAQEILAKRMAEVEARSSAKKDAIAALFAAYPDIRAWAKDLKDAGFPITVGALTWTIHGPSQTHTGYAATASTLGTPPSYPKRAKGGSGADRKRCSR